MDIHNLQLFKKKVAEGAICLGMVVTLSDPAVSELAAEVGYDFTWIDMEHAPISIESALGHVMAVRGTETAPFIRVPGNDPFIIKPILDLAPAGIIVPLINSAKEAQAAVQACRYPPEGIRGCGPRRGRRFGATSLPEYLSASKREPMIILQIEHIKAVENIDEILAVQGIDSICIGPNDLSGSMGMLGETTHPKVEEAVSLVCEKARNASMMIGTADTFSSQWIERGVQWIAVGSDCGSIFSDARHTLETIHTTIHSKKQSTNKEI
ncbi:MAG: aldolase/citrate lyase family protein [Candidatus Ratteibacteria bacterium]|jgi:2-dehydro-3-deoxyglucarate aldolase/4-hydroxy-2-oxoheptanedioate aldolase